MVGVRVDNRNLGVIYAAEGGGGPILNFVLVVYSKYTCRQTHAPTHHTAAHAARPAATSPE